MAQAAVTPIQQSSDYITTVSVCAGAVALLVLLISAIVRFIRRRGARARALKAARESRGSTPKLALSASNSDDVATEEASSKKSVIGSMLDWVFSRRRRSLSHTAFSTEPCTVDLREFLKPGDTLLKRFVINQLVEDMCTGVLLLYTL